MAYELFDSKSIRIGSPAITIQPDGRMALNADVGDILASLGAKYAQILWDRALNLRRAGKELEAQPLFRRIAEGTWQPRFQGLVNQARGEMGK